MKRKLLNAALFGAVLVAAPVSTFVSCADYDSDINVLNKQIEDLNDLVAKKEAVINDQIKNLDAQIKAVDEAYKKADADLKAQLEKAIKDGDAALQAQIEDCQTKCKAEFAAVRAELAAAKAELQDAIAAAEKKHGEDVAKLMAADAELQKAIDAAKAELAAADKSLQEQIDALKAYTDKELEQVYQQLEGVTQQISQVYNTLSEQISVINGQISELQTKVADVKAELLKKIEENAAAIKANKDLYDKHVKDFEAHKQAAETEFANVKAELAKKATKDEVAQLETTLRGLIQTNATAIAANKADIEKLQTAVAGLNDQVAKNTKAIVDNAARIVDLEKTLNETITNLGALKSEFEAYKVAQAAVDAAQDVALTEAVATLNETITGVKTELSNTIENKYQDALRLAREAAAAAEANAKAYADICEQNAKDYTDGALENYYDKAKVDELVAALEAADAAQDAAFREFVELQLNPAFEEVWEAIEQNATDIATNAGNIATNAGNIATNAARIEEVYNDVLDITDDLYRECQAIRDLIDLRVSELQENIDAVEAAYKAADAKMAADFREWIETELNPAFAALYEYIDNLGVELSAEVKGFVLEPASYYEGIQAIEGTSYEYHKWNVTDELNPVQDGDFVQYCPSVVAHYHVNPSAAKLSKDVANYKYAVLDRTNRGVNDQLKPVVTAVAQNEGMLDVTLRLTDASANKTPQGHQDPSEVTVMALQYTNPAAKAENQVVTSDYAVLFLNPLKEVSLVSATNSDHEITDVFADVVPNNDQDWVEYTQSYDIQEHIAAKFGGENSLSMTELPEGFTVKYTPVSGDVTYFTPITADGKITPQLPNGNPATTACVGKNATWRIDIMHGEDVVEVGFYKVTITGEAVIETAPAIVTDSILKVTCEPTDKALNVDLSIDNVWNKIVEVTGEELEKVKAKYSVSLDGDVVAQFKEYETTEDRVLYKQFTGKGVVTLNEDGTVNWTVIDNDPYVESDLRSATKEVKSMVTYIRVRSNDAISKDTYNEFYMPLIWTPNPIEFWGEYQELSWTYTRVANQWQDNKGTREEHELRLYADLTKSGTTPFTYNIPEKAMVNFSFDEIEKQLTFVGSAAEFVNVKNGRIVPTNGHFRFIQHPNEAARFYDVVAEDGMTDTYELTVSEDGKQLLAGRGRELPVVIATITEKGVVTLENNKVSQLLLNAHEKDELLYGQTLCARVGFAAECCAGKVEVIDGDFDVRFIKPLTVKADDINISDADDINNAGKITTSILGNIICFNNYTLAERPNYIEVFGVGITLGEIKDWKTNYNAAEDDFTKTVGDNKITDLFAKNEAKGEITYINNTAVVSEFSVIVPVTVKYNWNSEPISVNIKLNVGRTQGNSNRR